VTTFAEGALLFDFGDGWTVEKYDHHPAYRQGIERRALITEAAPAGLAVAAVPAEPLAAGDPSPRAVTRGGAHGWTRLGPAQLARAGSGAG
jgi:hypothetical protein